MHHLRRWASRLGLLAAVVMATGVAACHGGAVSSVGPNTLVDDWSIGEPLPCAGDQVDLCAAAVDVATGQLEGGSRARIVETVVHAEGLYPNLDGDLGMIYRGGPGVCCVVLFKLTDGSYRAVGIANNYPSTPGPYALEHGPGVRQEHTDFQPPGPTY
jgi:hypothetical protein